MKSILAAIGALSLVLFVGSHFLGGASDSDTSSRGTSIASGRTVIPEDIEIAVPALQKQLIDTIESFGGEYERAANEFQKSAIRRNRAIAIQAVLANRSIVGWMGTVDSMTTTGEGDGALSIKLTGSNQIKIKTWNNQLSDIGSNTLILQTSTVYNKVASLTAGQKVTFSGAFLLGRLDYLQEGSVTEEGSMTDPEFIFSFTNIGPASATEQAVTAPLAKNNGDTSEPPQVNAGTDRTGGVESERSTISPKQPVLASGTGAPTTAQPTETANTVSESAQSSTSPRP